MKVSIKGVVLYHLFSSLYGILHNISVSNKHIKKEPAEQLLQLQEGERLAVEVCRIEGDTRDK